MIDKVVEVGSAVSSSRIVPHTSFALTYELDYSQRSGPVGKQWARYDEASPYESVSGEAGDFAFLRNDDYFRTNFAAARTFGWLEDMPIAHAVGLSLGATLENCIVIDKDGNLISDTVSRSMIPWNDKDQVKLRWENEFARHKLVDAIGDLMLCGTTRIRGHYFGNKSGHATNQELVKAIFDDPSNYHWEESKE